MPNLILSALSGLLLSCAFEPVGIWWLAPLAIAAHIFAIASARNKVASVFLFAFVFNAITLHWSSTYVGSIPWLILALGLSLFYLPLALVSKWGISSYPLIFIILEEIRNRVPFGGFGWLRVAYTQADAPYAKLAAIGGVTALSAASLLIGLAIFQISSKKFTVVTILPFLLLLIPVNLQSSGSTDVLLVQGNVPELGLDFNSRAKEVFYNHLEETKKSLLQYSDVDFVLWPENSVDVDPFINKDVSNSLDLIKKPLIIGAIVRQDGKLLNTSILWSSTDPKIYTKQHLTPFGEYIPLRSLATFISPFTNQVEDFSPGNSQRIFTINQAQIAPIICYELIDDEILHKAAINSNILAVQTNSATFGMSAQSAQQLSITRVRAIEHGRNVISVSTTGYSAVIDSQGKVLQKTSMATAESIYAKVELIENKTPRDRYGDWALIISLFMLLMVARKGYR